MAQSKTDQAPDVPKDDPMVGEETLEKLNERLRGLMNKSKIMLFMKGTPDAPRCGFSRKTVAILREQDVKFEHFDILSDESVRQGKCWFYVHFNWLILRHFVTGLKDLNEWPTFPQIIVNGQFMGGLDVLTEAVKSGEFKELLTS